MNLQKDVLPVRVIWSIAQMIRNVNSIRGFNVDALLGFANPPARGKGAVPGLLRVAPTPLKGASGTDGIDAPLRA